MAGALALAFKRMRAGGGPDSTTERRGWQVGKVARATHPHPRIGEILLVTVQVDMHDRLATLLKDDLANRISETGARGVLIDISALDVVDSFNARMFGAIAQVARVMDADTALVGMQPSVATTLVEMGISHDWGPHGPEHGEGHGAPSRPDGRGAGGCDAPAE